MEPVIEHGLDGMAEAIRLLINLAMEIERDKYLGVLPYERSERRRGWRNGYKSKSVKTQLGKLEFSVPQVRGAEFYPRRRGRKDRIYFFLIRAQLIKKGVLRTCSLERSGRFTFNIRRVA